MQQYYTSNYHNHVELLSERDHYIWPYRCLVPVGLTALDEATPTPRPPTATLLKDREEHSQQQPNIGFDPY